MSRRRATRVTAPRPDHKKSPCAMEIPSTYTQNHTQLVCVCGCARRTLRKRRRSESVACLSSRTRTCHALQSCGVRQRVKRKSARSPGPSKALTRVNHALPLEQQGRCIWLTALSHGSCSVAADDNLAARVRLPQPSRRQLRRSQVRRDEIVSSIAAVRSGG